MVRGREADGGETCAACGNRERAWQARGCGAASDRISNGAFAMVAVVRSLASTDAEAEEWRLRCDMAAVFRVCARLGWNEQIGNHNSLMLPQRSRDDTPKSEER